MNNEEIQYEYYEYVSPYNVLVVSSDGELIDVQCPFEVRSKVTFPDLKINDCKYVQKVQTTSNQMDVFIIDGNAYRVGYFQVILEQS